MRMQRPGSPASREEILRTHHALYLDDFLADTLSAESIRRIGLRP